MEIKISDKYLWIVIVVFVAVGLLLSIIGFIMSAVAGRDTEQALNGLLLLLAGIALAAIPYLLAASFKKMLSAMSNDADSQTE